jgi:hypothetical protein
MSIVSMTRVTRLGRRGLLAVTTTALMLQLHTGASIAAAPYKTFYPVGEPVQLDLPPAWAAYPPSQGVAFIAYDPTSSQDVATAANVNIAVTTFRNASFKHFASAAIAAIRQQDLTTDPRATDRWRKIVLPAGQAVEVIESLRLTVAGKRVLYAGIDYAFLHDGRSYSFNYIVPASKRDQYFPIFRRSAKAIRFKPH